MDTADIDLRNATYRAFVELGRAPSAEEIAARSGLATDSVRGGWRRLHEAHAVVLDGETGGIRMLNPFSAVPTAFPVEAAGRSWYAPCAWDAFGIGAALHVDSAFETRCPDCDEPIRIAIHDGRPSDASPLFHVLVPARSWWANIGFT